jgi:hypothetical protein
VQEAVGNVNQTEVQEAVQETVTEVQETLMNAAGCRDMCAAQCENAGGRAQVRVCGIRCVQACLAELEEAN